jgi:hypothetical protein
LDRAKASGVLGYFGILKVLWLDDSRMIDFLIELLPQKDRDSIFWRTLQRVSFRLPLRPFLARAYIAHASRHAEGFCALSLLNQLEFGGPGKMVEREIWRSPSDYRAQRHQVAFRERMIAAAHRWNQDGK